MLLTHGLMPPFELVRCPRNRLVDLLHTIAVPLAWEITDPEIAAWTRVLDPDRVFLAIDDGMIVGGGGAFAFDMSVPGGNVAIAGITAVGVLPSHRRMGIASEVVAQLLADAAGRGEILAALWASQGAIYQRFGFGLATQAMAIEVDRRDTAFLGEVRRPSVSLLSADSAATAFSPLYERARQSRSGMMSRSASWWEARGLVNWPTEQAGSRGLSYALLVEDGAPAAYAIYRVRKDSDIRGPRYRLDVAETVSLTPSATAGMWRFLFDLDLVGEIRASRLPVDHPLPHLMIEPRRLGMTVTDGLWVRLIDARAALSARAYSGCGDLVLDIDDPLNVSNSGSILLSATVTGGDVRPTEDAADLRMGIAELSAAYLGGTSFATLAAAGRVVEIRAGAAAQADALFATTRAPWCVSLF